MTKQDDRLTICLLLQMLVDRTTPEKLLEASGNRVDLCNRACRVYRWYEKYAHGWLSSDIEEYRHRRFIAENFTPQERLTLAMGGTVKKKFKVDMSDGPYIYGSG